ncbi:MAG TPA: GNAT family N-acetyltransferase [Panacibacter sp.]|nr:GNAT family N-acetyltransferase [Panacibacter sp.]
MAEHNFVIRKILPADVAILRQISIDSFVETYAIYNTEEDMQLHIESHFNREQLLNEIENAQNYFFVAMFADEPAGYIKLRTSENPAELVGFKHIELERIYALKRFQGMGLGKRLIQQGMDTGIQNGYEILWLGVWKQNEKAIQFYTRQGFTIFGEHAFILGADQQTDWLMKKALNP